MERLVSGSEQVGGDWGYIVSWNLKPAYMEFTASRITSRSIDGNYVEASEEQIEGSIKWDGCANIAYDNYMHYCEPSDFILQANVLEWVYSKARELIPENEIGEWV